MNPKIIATIGPVSEEPGKLQEIIKSGANILRVNFSHGTFEQWNRIKENAQGQAEMMMDLQGPRIRVGKILDPIKVEKGITYAIFCGEKANSGEIPVDYCNLYKDVKKGEPIYFTNKTVELVVDKVLGKKIYATAHNGGTILSRKGVNFPKTDLSINVLGKKDIEDAKFGAKNGAKYICLSFVKQAKDIKQLRKIVGNDVKIIAKIERELALQNVDEIIRESDGIMIARGDLGIEVPIEELAIIQKDLIRHAHQHKKPAIVATEMLASMVSKAYPTRAEAADVANAVFDGADAIMLSDETAFGNHPVESVAMMKKISQRVDEYFNATNYFDGQLSRA